MLRRDLCCRDRAPGDLMSYLDDVAARIRRHVPADVLPVATRRAVSAVRRPRPGEGRSCDRRGRAQRLGGVDAAERHGPRPHTPLRGARPRDAGGGRPVRRRHPRRARELPAVGSGEPGTLVGATKHAPAPKRPHGRSPNKPRSGRWRSWRGGWRSAPLSGRRSSSRWPAGEHAPMMDKARRVCGRVPRSRVKQVHLASPLRQSPQRRAYTERGPARRRCRRRSRKGDLA